ncbi:MAG TPA: ATP-binding protein [Gemmatimonadales bacterium]|nr:ATP-binding protein [Gemmatimonadales bacterium]
MWRAILPTLLISILVSVAVEQFYRQTALRDERLAVTATTTGTANAVAVAVNRRLALLAGLHAFLEVNWDREGLPRDFDEFAGRLQGSAPGVRTLQWVQDGMIRQTYPRVGNEAVIGYNLRTDPRAFIRADLARAEASSTIVLSGPTELVQGGLGVIGRLAVANASGHRVGLAAIVLDVEPILAEAGVAADPTLMMVITAPRRGTFAGDSSILSRDPVRVTVPLPEGAWELAALPAAGWGHAGSAGLSVVRGVLLLVIGLSTLVAWLLVGRHQARLREAEMEARRVGQERFSRLFALMPDGAVISRMRDNRIIEVNPSAEVLMGRTREEVIGRTSLELDFWVTPDDRARVRHLIETEGLAQNLPAQFKTPDGRIRDGLFSGRAIEVGEESCWLSLFRDVTEQRELEAQLAHAQKLEAVGRLAGGVAHDFNNLITAIAGYAELLRSGFDHDDARRADVDEILRASGRAARLTQQLLAFARRQMVQPRVVDLNEVVASVTSLLRRLLGADIVLDVATRDEPVPVLIDPGQFEQLLANLAVNSRDAMPSGGHLSVGVEAKHGSAVLTVRDTGQGMGADVLAQAFEPFFTTKGPGKGTGLGLSTSYGIVQQAGGTITVKSEVSTGTSFTIVLPLAEGQVSPVQEVHAEHKAPGGSETVLVAEDEPQVRRLAERALRAAGYQVLSASDGAQALARSREVRGQIHLLVTDVVMPEMGGPELATAFLTERPDARVLYISGYTEDEVARQGLAAAGLAFLPKPFTPSELTDRVRELLDPPESPLT